MRGGRPGQARAHNDCLQGGVGQVGPWFILTVFGAGLARAQRPFQGRVG